MSLDKIFDISGSAMTAQSLRLNLTASNLANADSLSSNPDTVYKARHPVFQAMFQNAMDQEAVGVQSGQVVESQAPAQARYMPGHPLADENGYVYAPNVNPVEEMVNMISASRSYQNNVEALNTSKDLLLRTLQLGK